MLLFPSLLTTLLYIVRGSIESCKKLVTKAIEIIYRILGDIGLELSPHKTVLVYFNRRGGVSLKIRDVEVTSSQTAKFLGIIFDYRLNFTRQVDKVRKNAIGP